jgi:hypothetical protein
VDNSQIYFSNIEKIVKFYQVENAQEMIDRTESIKQYLDGLNIDKRKVAVGFDVLIWYFDMFSSDTTMWNQNFSSTYGGASYEEAFLLAKPGSSLLTFPAWNTGLARLMDARSTMTLVNSYQLDIFEQFCKKETETWNYGVVSKAQVEQGAAGPFDFIAMNTYDIVHDPILAVQYFNMLTTGGVMVIGHANDGGALYEAGAEYSPYYEINDHLKGLENSIVYHDYTTMGTTVAIKL